MKASPSSPTLAWSDGPFEFKADHHWAKLPPDIQPGNTHGVVEDGAGRIYIANQSRHAILIFDAEGHYLTSWGESYASGAHGLAIHREGGNEFLYLSNTSLEEVVKTTLDGKVIWKIGTPPIPSIYDDKKRFSPTETAVAPDGTVYVADGYGQPHVHVYDREGRYLSTFGGPGAAPGQLAQPHGICVDAREGRPTVLVANRANRRIDRFSLEGAFQETIIGPEYLRFPCTAVLSGNELYVPDLFGRVSIFDRHHHRVTHLGDYLEGREWNKPWGSFHELDPGLAGYPNIAHAHRRPGRFSSPHGLCVDHAGDVFVVEWIPDGRITKLTRKRV